MDSEDLKDAAQVIFDQVGKEVRELASSRCLEIDPQFPNEGVPNAPKGELSTDELSQIEVLNSIRDVRMRLEVRILRLEVQVKQQKLAAKEAACSEAEERRALATELKDYLRLTHNAIDRQAHQMKLANKEVDIEVRLADCQSAVDKRQAELSSLQEMDTTNEILKLVQLSSAALTRLMHLEGHQSQESLAAATSTVEAEAAGVERELDELQRQIAAMETRIRGSPSRTVRDPRT